MSDKVFICMQNYNKNHMARASLFVFLVSSKLDTAGKFGHTDQNSGTKNSNGTSMYFSSFNFSKLLPISMMEEEYYKKLFLN